MKREIGIYSYLIWRCKFKKKKKKKKQNPTKNSNQTKTKKWSSSQSDRTQAETLKSLTTYKKYFFVMWTIKLRNRLLREAVEKCLKLQLRQGPLLSKLYTTCMCSLLPPTENQKFFSKVSHWRMSFSELGWQFHCVWWCCITMKSISCSVLRLMSCRKYCMASIWSQNEFSVVLQMRINEHRIHCVLKLK